MAGNKNVKPMRIEERGPGTDLATAAISGTTGGVAGVIATQVMAKLAGAEKAKDPPRK
jgi:uncharacterized phage protein gp47/JayE